MYHHVSMLQIRMFFWPGKPHPEPFINYREPYPGCSATTNFSGIAPCPVDPFPRFVTARSPPGHQIRSPGHQIAEGPAVSAIM